jgi:hypothetical protein
LRPALLLFLKTLYWMTAALVALLLARKIQATLFWTMLLRNRVP